MAWLEALTAPDLGAFIEGLDFAATQEMTEEVSQEVTYRGAFGVDGPVIRSVRRSDEGRFSFSAILLKRGVERGMNDEDFLVTLRDFEVVTRRGSKRNVYRGCNWTNIRVRSTLDEVRLECDITIPGYVRE